MCVLPAQVAPNSVADVQLSYQPGSYRTLEHATVTVSSQAAGSYEFNCTGQVRGWLSRWLSGRGHELGGCLCAALLRASGQCTRHLFVC